MKSGCIDDEEFWSDRFHHCALAAGFIAAGEGRLGDSLYVRDLAYRMYEEGAFREQASAIQSQGPASPGLTARTPGRKRKRRHVVQ